MRRNIVHVLDIGSHTIKALSAERESLHTPLRILGWALIPSEGMRRGQVVRGSLLAEKIKQALREVKRSSGIPFHNVWLTFGSSALGFQKSHARIQISVASGEISSYDVARVLQEARPSNLILQNREILETFGLTYTIDSELPLKDPLGMKGETLEAEVLLMSALKKPLKEFVSVVEETGLEIEDVIPTPLALSRASLSSRQREVGALVVDIGAQTLGVGIFEENLPYSLAVFPLGSDHITNDIALGFQVSLEAAERIKTTARTPEETGENKRKFVRITEARLEDMFELVETHLKKQGRAGLLPGGVAISGGGAKLPGIVEFAKRALELPVELAECSELEAGHELHDPVWQGALGLCLVALDEEGKNRSRDKRSSRFIQKLSSWFRSLIP